MRVIFCLFILFIAIKTNAQVVNNIDVLIEDISSNLEKEIENIDIYDLLQHYAKNPIDINTNNTDELASSMLFNETQINNLLNYRIKNGNLLHVTELQMVPGFDISYLRNIKPLLKCNEANIYQVSWKKMLTEGEHQIYLRAQQNLQQAEGFKPNITNGYEGNAQKYIFRYKYAFTNQVQWGITAEKDAGESFFAKNQKQGFDFYSAHFFTRSIKNISALAIGDYELRFGQGLLMWNGLANSKSSMTNAIKRRAFPLKAYSSVAESGFNRGIAATIKANKFLITPFASYQKRGANVVNTNEENMPNNDEFISSLDEGGLHRTANEIADKNIITQISAGGNIQYRSKKSTFGFSSTFDKLSIPLASKSDWYNQNSFSGNMLIAGSFDYSFTLKQALVFGETAANQKGEWATTNGIILPIDKSIDISVLYRHFSRNYFSFHAQAFSENTLPNNERAIYFGLEAKPFPKWRLNAYADYFTFPFLKYNVDAPSSGNDYLTQITYNPSRAFEIYARFRHRTKYENTAKEAAIDYITPIVQNQLRIHMQYKLTPTLILRNRVAWSFQDKEQKASNGYMIYTEALFKPLSSPWDLAFRYGIFNTEDYDSRIYAYENDVLYSFAIPAFYYKGTRSYLNIHYILLRKIDIYARLAHTFYNREKTIGSGLDEIQGNQKTEIKLAIRLRI